MKKKIFYAGLGIIAVALSGCGSRHFSPASESSLRGQVTSSAVKSEAAQAGRAILATCVPAKDITQAYLVSLALSPAKVHDLAQKCNIPHGKRTAFVKAVLASAGNAYMRGVFRTPAGRQDWADKVFPVILRTYQAR